MIEPIVYMTEDGSELYLPVSAFTLNEARHEAARFAAQEGGFALRVISAFSTHVVSLTSRREHGG